MVCYNTLTLRCMHDLSVYQDHDHRISIVVVPTICEKDTYWNDRSGSYCDTSSYLDDTDDPGRHQFSVSYMITKFICSSSWFFTPS